MCHNFFVWLYTLRICIYITAFVWLNHLGVQRVSLNVRICMCFWVHLHACMSPAIAVAWTNHLSKNAFIFIWCYSAHCHLSTSIVTISQSASFIFFETSFASHPSISYPSSSFSSSFCCSPHLVFNPTFIFIPQSRSLTIPHCSVTPHTELPWKRLFMHDSVWQNF